MFQASHPVPVADLVPPLGAGDRLRWWGLPPLPGFAGTPPQGENLRVFFAGTPPSGENLYYHIDSNTAVLNVSSSFTAVAHASVHDDAHVGASEYDCRYIQYDVGPVSYP